MPAPMHVAMVGTRGIPARYGGFETAVEEIGRRLVSRGHCVTVYCRGSDPEHRKSYDGMQLVHLPALRTKALETPSHTALSTLHALVSQTPPAAAVVFNAANAPLLPLFRLRGIPTAVHVDGLEWQRAKWGRVGRRYYRVAEALAVRFAEALIADSQGIAAYYRHKFNVSTELLSYGAPLQTNAASDRLEALSLLPNSYHLVVSRFEPENHVLDIVVGYHRSAAELPLIVVGSAPYAAAYTSQIHAVARNDDRIRLIGSVWDQGLLDQLYTHALTYLHGHSVGGTNPSLLRAMGAGTATIAFDVVFNQEVLGDDGLYFTHDSDVAQHVEVAEKGPEDMIALGVRLRASAANRYQWDEVALGYEQMLRRLVAQRLH